MIDEDRSGAEATPEPERVPLLARPAFKVLFILLAAALMLVLLGLLISPRYWRF